MKRYLLPRALFFSFFLSFNIFSFDSASLVTLFQCSKKELSKSELFMDSPECLEAAFFVEKNLEEMIQLSLHENFISPKKEALLLSYLWGIIHYNKGKELLHLQAVFTSPELSLAFFYLKRKKNDFILPLKEAKDIYQTLYTKKFFSSFHPGKQKALEWLAQFIVVQEFKELIEATELKEIKEKITLLLKDLETHQYPKTSLVSAYVELMGQYPPMMADSFALNPKQNESSFLQLMQDNETPEEFLFSLSGKLQAVQWASFSPISAAYAPLGSVIKQNWGHPTEAKIGYDFGTRYFPSQEENIQLLNPHSTAEARCEGGKGPSENETARVDYVFSGKQIIPACDAVKKPCFPRLKIYFKGSNPATDPLRIIQRDHKNNILFTKNLLPQESLELSRFDGPIELSFFTKSGCNQVGRGASAGYTGKDFFIEYDSFSSKSSPDNLSRDNSLLSSFKDYSHLIKGFLKNSLFLKQQSLEERFFFPLLLTQILQHKKEIISKSSLLHFIQFANNFLVSNMKFFKEEDIEKEFAEKSKKVNELEVQAKEIKSLLEIELAEESSLVVSELSSDEKLKLIDFSTYFASFLPQENNNLQDLVDFYHSLSQEHRLISLKENLRVIHEDILQLRKEQYPLAVFIATLESLKLKGILPQKKEKVRLERNYLKSLIEDVYRKRNY